MKLESHLEMQWTAFVEKSPHASPGHDIRWRQVISESLGHQPEYMLAIEDGQVQGVLPLFKLKHRVLGKRLVSVPVLDQAGILAVSDRAKMALYDQLDEMVRSKGFRYAQLRCPVDKGVEYEETQKAVLMLDLPQDASRLWESFKPKVRNEVRKAERSGLTVQMGGAELLPDFFHVYSHNMRDLGVPCLPYSLFDRTFQAFGEQALVVTVRHENEPVGSGIMMFFRNSAAVPWASSLRQYFTYCPNNLLYWKALQTACDRGYSIFDFGRSTRDSGPYRFKKQWGAVPYALHWDYCCANGNQNPNFTTDNPRFRFLVKVWRNLPVPVTNILGPKISGQVA